MEWLTFQSDGARLLTVSNDKAARVWDVQTCTPTSPEMPHDGDEVPSSPDGTRILTWQGSVGQVREGRNGVAMGEPLRHKEAILAAWFLAKGDLVLTISGEYAEGFIEARIGDTLTGTLLGSPLWRAPGKSALLSPDQTILATNNEKTLAFSDVALI